MKKGDRALGRFYCTRALIPEGVSSKFIGDADKLICDGWNALSEIFFCNPKELVPGSRDSLVLPELNSTQSRHCIKPIS